MMRYVALVLALAACGGGGSSPGTDGGLPIDAPQLDAAPIDAPAIDAPLPNRSPQITSTAPTGATEDVPYVYAPVAVDPDGPDQRWTLLPFHTCGGAIDAATGVFTFTAADPIPPCMLALRVCDRGTPELCATETATIAVAAANDPPTITSAPPPGATEGTPYVYVASATDVDSPAWTWSVRLDDTCGGAIDATTGRYTFTPPTPVSPPSCVLAIAACDDGTPASCAIQTVTLAITLVNSAPVIDSTAPTRADEDLPYVYSATRVDPDGPGQIWSLAPQHTCGGTIDAATGVYTLTVPGPVPAISSCRVGVQVCDGGMPSRCTAQYTNIGVWPVDDHRVAVDDGQRVVMQDAASIRFDVFTNDVDPDGGPYEPLLTVSQPAHGLAWIAPGGYDVMYTPEPGYCNSQPLGPPDTFTYTLPGGSVGRIWIRVACPAPPFDLAAGRAFACARFENDMVRCWGDNAGAQLGNGDFDDRGDGETEMGPNLPPVWLGTDRVVLALSTGAEHACAILDDHTVRCWGYGQGGRLGNGGGGLGTAYMGDYLAPVPLGTGRTAVAISAGQGHSCAILDNGALKCWGNAFWGQLGLGSTTARGDNPGEMGDALPAVALGTGRTALAVTAGARHTCAILDDHSLKCWGYNGDGQLGTRDELDRGTGPDQMGDHLAPIPLGAGRTAVAVALGESHTCALLDDGTVKCWGGNYQGELGRGNTFRYGGFANQMGDDLAPIPLGTGRTALAITAGIGRTCALLDDHTAKCWGWNDAGMLGLGDTLSRGDQPGEMGDALPAISLGTGRTVLKLAAGSYFTCALLDNRAIKCWGSGEGGVLGVGGTGGTGESPLGMGDNLRAIRF